MNLLQIKNNEYAVIESIPDDESGKRLEALGLRVGKRIHKISGMPWSGPITVELDGRHFAVAHNVAVQIRVTPTPILNSPEPLQVLPQP